VSTNVADTIASAQKTLLKPGERWAYGPICFAGERKAYVSSIDSYKGWIDEVDKHFMDLNSTVQRIRMMYYGKAVKALETFDDLIKVNSSWADFPLTREDVSAQTMDGLTGTGWVNTGTGVDPQRFVDLSHSWVLMDRELNGQRVEADLIDEMAPVIGLMSWTGDLASWWTEYSDRKACAIEAQGSAWKEDPTDLATPTGMLMAGQATRCALDDIYGDMDGFVLAFQVSNQATNPWSAGELAQKIADYYDPTKNTNSQNKAFPHSDNRFHLFVQYAVPQLPWSYAPGGNGAVVLNANAKDEIRKIVTDATKVTLMKARGVGPGLLRDIPRPWNDPYNAVIGAVVAAGTYLAIEKTVDRDLASPWGVAMLNKVADTFFDFLTAGLAGTGWTSGTWPTADFDFFSKTRGGVALQLGDNDAKGIYGGVTQAPAKFVSNLQTDLYALGFTSVGKNPDGVFGPITAMTLREFQIEATQDKVYATYDAPQTGTAILPTIRRYRGPINGVSDLETAAALHSWITPSDPPKHCLDRGGPGRGLLHILNPLTIQSRGGTTLVPGAVVNPDVWWFDQETRANTTDKTYPWVFAVDQLQRYTIPPTQILPGPDSGSVCIGRYTTQGGGGPVLELYKPGTQTLGQDPCWYSQLISRDNLVPPPLDPGAATVRSQYRVIRAVAEVECLGYFDVINSWDAARLSFGLFHWAFQTPQGGPSELGALLAYYKSIDLDGYAHDFGRFGIEPEKPWDPKTFGAEVPAKYIARVAMYGLYDSIGVIRADQLIPLETGNLTATDYLGDWLRSWRNIHRVAMALRTSQSLRRAQWQFASMRLADLLGLTWPVGGPDVPVVTVGAAQQAASVGQVFTSERAVAALIRWHVNYPDSLLPPLGSNLQAAYVGAFGPGQVDVGSGTQSQKDGFQESLVAHVLIQAGLVDMASGTDLFNTITTALAYGSSASVGDPLSDLAGSYIGH
jgi:hypothetical protein